jgi:hypothetical protein
METNQTAMVPPSNEVSDASRHQGTRPGSLACFIRVNTIPVRLWRYVETASIGYGRDSGEALCSGFARRWGNRRRCDELLNSTGTQRNPLHVSEKADPRRLTPAGMAREATDTVESISWASIKSHMRAIYRELGVHAREDAVARATALGLLEQTESPG